MKSLSALIIGFMVLTSLGGVEPKYVNHNDVRGKTPTMTNVQEWAESVFLPENQVGITNGTIYIKGQSVTPSGAKAEYSWSSPDCWEVMVNSQVTVDEHVITNVDVDAWYRIQKKVTQSTSYSPYAQAHAHLLDISSINTPVIERWDIEGDGATIDQTGYITTSKDGMFKVKAWDTNGVYRATDFAMNTYYSDAKIITNITYEADADGYVRKAVNDQALLTLQNATSLGEKTRGGYTYTLLNTFQPRFTQKRAGNVSCFAVSQHILASAKHYGSGIRWLGNQTFDDGAGHTATVKKLKWVDLYSWALTNGWTEAELSDMNIGDIALIQCDKATAVPDGCIPYFMTEEKRQAWFGASMLGVAGWYYPQEWDVAVQLTFNSDTGWTEGYGLDRNARKDLATFHKEFGNSDVAYSGDSGKPVFVMKGNMPIIVSAHFSIGGGPNYIKGFPVIKAFVEAYGDTIKEAQ